MHNKFEFSAPTLVKTGKNLNKTAILISAISEHVRELVISNMHNKFEQDK